MWTVSVQSPPAAANAGKDLVVVPCIALGALRWASPGSRNAKLLSTLRKWSTKKAEIEDDEDERDFYATHGYLDCGLGLILIIGPLIFGFGGDGTASWVLIIAGVLLIGLSLMTRYELGAIKAVPMPAHLGMDAVLGLVLIASPWVFGFADVIWWPHVLVGLLEIGTAAMTERRPGFETSRSTL